MKRFRTLFSRHGAVLFNPRLTERFPAHIVCAWIGNTVKVATTHYLQVRDSDFEKAISNPSEAAQNQAQQADNSTRTKQKASMPTNHNRPQLPGDANQCNHLRNSQVGRLGLEPRTNGLKVRCSTN